jgi:hypothetical protein
MSKTSTTARIQEENERRLWPFCEWKLLDQHFSEKPLPAYGLNSAAKRSNYTKNMIGNEENVLTIRETPEKQGHAQNNIRHPTAESSLRKLVSAG